MTQGNLFEEPEPIQTVMQFTDRPPERKKAAKSEFKNAVRGLLFIASYLAFNAAVWCFCAFVPFAAEKIRINLASGISLVSFEGRWLVTA